MKSHHREIRAGGKTVIYTIGYEKRDGEDLIAALKDAGVKHLADIREKPFSRKADFRAKALKASCESAGIEYGPWTSLGTPQAQRDKVKETADIERFFRTFRAYAIKHMNEPLDELATIAKRKTIALLCYERAHDECHRSVIADLLAERIDATIVAIE